MTQLGSSLPPKPTLSLLQSSNSQALCCLDSFYSRGETTLQFGGEQSSRISCKQGVKQRDPLSPVLFNFVVVWCLEDPDPSIGFRWPEAMCNYLAFADNLVLFAESRQDLQSQLNRLVTALGSCGLTINAAKCSSMVLTVYGRVGFVEEGRTCS